MRLFKALVGLAIVLLMQPLYGCVTLGALVAGVGTAETVYSQVQAVYAKAPLTLFVAKSGYAITLTAAATFKADVCPSVNSHVWCLGAVQQLRAANNATAAAFASAEAFIKAHPTLDASGLITAAENAALGFAKVETAFGVPAK
jgi:hypothetical protein